MSKLSNNKKMIILIVVIVALAVAIIFSVNNINKNGQDYSGKASAGSEQSDDKSIVMEDSATVEVQISEGAAKKKSE